MLLSIQYPFADTRMFLQNTHKLNVPVWPIPIVNKEFVRHFGIIRNRQRGGIGRWIGENETCEARKALRFCGNLIFIERSSNLKINLRCAFRRLYFDGWAVGKYEIGIATNFELFQRLNNEQSKRFFEHILKLPLNIEGINNTTIINANNQIAEMYLSSTTKNGHKTKPWWVIAGSPFLFLEYSSEEINIPYRMDSIPISNSYNFQLFHSFIPFAGSNYHLWILRHPIREDYTNIKKSRELRISMMRLNAEQECLRLVYRNIRLRKLIVSRGTTESDDLQNYLKKAKSKINRMENFSKYFNPEIVNYARQSLNTISPGQKDSLLVALKDLDLRNNIHRSSMDYLIDWIMSKKIPGFKKLWVIIGGLGIIISLLTGIITLLQTFKIIK